MTLDDYLGARMISTPLCLFDCDAPGDGSTAVVVSHATTPRTRPHPACHVNAVGTALRGRASWDQFDDLTTMAARDAAASMWERTELRPADVDVAQLYDGFSHPGHGVARGPRASAGGARAAAFVEDGRPHRPRRRACRSTPRGGQLSGGRLHGFGLHPRGLRAAPGRGRRPPGPRSGDACRRWPR